MWEATIIKNYLSEDQEYRMSVAIMAALQIQESGGKGAPDVIVTSKGKSLRGSGVSLRTKYDKLVIKPWLKRSIEPTRYSMCS